MAILNFDISDNKLLSDIAARGEFMRIAIVGSRNPGDIDFEAKLHNVIIPGNRDVIISGGAEGIDTMAAEYSRAHRTGLLEMRPNYDKYGRAATFVRNRQIVATCDVLVAFWNGRSKGTKYTIDCARKKNRKVVIINI